MDADRLRAYLLTFPHVVEAMQWGENLVFRVGDKAIGGKMFALINLEQPPPGDRRRVTGHGVMTYPAEPARFAEMLEIEGLVPAPYLARAHWVAATDWDVFTIAEWHRELRAAYDLTLAKLPPKTRRILALPPAEYRRAVAAGRKLLAAKK